MARALAPSLTLQRGEPVARAGGGVQRGGAGLRPAIAAGGKEGEDGVADDVEHLAALLHHGARGAIEIGVEQVEKGFDRELVGKAGRVTQVAVPERGGKPLAVAALDRAGQNAAADKGPVKGVERGLGDLVLDGEAKTSASGASTARMAATLAALEALRGARRP